MRKRKQAREMQEKREDQRPILKKLRAALLGSFKGAARRKNELCKGGPGVTGTLGKAKSHFYPTQMGSGTAPPG